MGTKKNGAKLRLEVTSNQDIDGHKGKLYTVKLKKGSSTIEVGQFLATSESAAKKKAKTVVRAAL